MPQEDAGDKTEQPTPRRRAEAREEGQVARSQDLTAAISLIGGLVMLKFLGPGMLEEMLNMTAAIGEVPDVAAGGLWLWIRRIGGAAMRMVLPFLLFVLLLTVAGAVAQTGLLVSWKKLALKPDRISPISGLKRLFSFESLNRLFINLFKVGVIAAIAYVTIVNRVNDVLATGSYALGGVYLASVALLFELSLKMTVALLVLGIIDYLVQRWRHEKELRMTKQEVRDELKRMEGDPLVKHRRRQLQARLAMQRVQAEVPKADVVVTNPTEYAVAIRYDQAAMTAPKVVAKGKDFLAQRIRQVAQMHGVPVVERPPLARALYAGVEVGQEIPPKFYQAVAELLAYVYRLTGRAAG